MIRHGLTLIYFISLSFAQPSKIIFILADDLDYVDLGAFWKSDRIGNPICTPELD
jgi:hypothetical protein